ncbi:MAG: cytochrome c3 family protein [Acidobacteriota bacterium]
MTQGASTHRWLSRAVFCLWLSLAGATFFHEAGPVIAQSEDNCVACHSRQKNDARQVVAIFQTSTHARAMIGCDGCHGGDLSQPAKIKAHAGRFIGRPDTAATLEMCGKCHRQPLELFKQSRHVASRPNAGRLDCVECHGVHSIGAASESFRWPMFCAGCHGLEYLPQLGRPFQEMLALADDLNDGLHRLEAKGRAPARDLIDRRKEIRHLISELVHKTDRQGGVERIQRVLELGVALKRQIATEEQR